MRRLLLSLPLVLCLCLAQYGALLHALGHETPNAAPASGGESRHPGAPACLTCLAFAHVAGIAAGAGDSAPLLSLGFHWTVPTAPAWRPSEAPSARSRGPPGLF